MSRRIASVPPVAGAPGIEIDEEFVKDLPIPGRRLNICTIASKNGTDHEYAPHRVTFKAEINGDNVVISGGTSDMSRKISKTRNAEEFFTQVAREVQASPSLSESVTLKSVTDEIMRDVAAGITNEVSNSIALDVSIAGTGVLYANNEPRAGFSSIVLKEVVNEDTDDKDMLVSIEGCTKLYDLDSLILPVFKFWYDGNMLEFYVEKDTSKCETIADGPMEGAVNYTFLPKLKYKAQEKDFDFPTFDGNFEQYREAVNKALGVNDKDKTGGADIFANGFSLI